MSCSKMWNILIYCWAGNMILKENLCPYFSCSRPVFPHKQKELKSRLLRNGLRKGSLAWNIKPICHPFPTDAEWSDEYFQHFPHRAIEEEENRAEREGEK